MVLQLGNNELTKLVNQNSSTYIYTAEYGYIYNVMYISCSTSYWENQSFHCVHTAHDKKFIVTLCIQYRTPLGWTHMEDTGDHCMRP